MRQQASIVQSPSMAELTIDEQVEVNGGIAPLLIIVGKGLAQGLVGGAALKGIELSVKYLLSE
jgi:hypothetical protein